MTDQKRGFNLNQLAKPIAELQTSQGAIYIYSPTGTVLKLHRELGAETVDARAARTLAHVASQVMRDRLLESVVPLPEDVFNALDEAEVSRLVELFWQHGATQRAKLQPSRATLEPQQEGESSLAFFDRTLDHYAREEDAQIREQHAKMMDMLKSPADKLLEQLHASSDKLGGTLRAYESLKAPEITPIRDYVGDMARAAAKERDADRQVARLTAEMTKESAEMLRDLVDAAGKFLVRFDERDRVSDAQTKGQLRIALISLGLSVVLAGIGVWYARAAYVQDYEKNTADAVSAADASEFAASAARRYEALLTEQTRALQEQSKALHALQEQNAMLLARQASTLPAKKGQH